MDTGSIPSGTGARRASGPSRRLFPLLATVIMAAAAPGEHPVRLAVPVLVAAAEFASQVAATVVTRFGARPV